MSLHPQTIRVQHRLAQWTKSGRKHWDLHRWVFDPYLHYFLDSRFEEIREAHPRTQLIRFADDFIAIAETRAELVTLRRCIYV